MAARDHPLLGKWRIIEMALWDSDFLDLVEPAYIRFDAQGRGEFVFGAVQGSSTAATARPASASPGKAPTRWTPPPAPVTPSSTRTGSSRARSASTTATTPPSRRADGDAVELRSAAILHPSSSSSRSGYCGGASPTCFTTRG